MKVFAVIFCLVTCIQSVAQPLATRFTFQGQLDRSGLPANGNFDFEFELFDVEDGGSFIDDTVVLNDVAVANGIFSVELDFGSEPFAGDQLWLLVRTRDGASDGNFTELSPRQKITAVPYALHAEMVAMDAIGQAEIATNAVGANEIASGAVGSDEIDADQVQRRVSAGCTANTSVTSINPDGSVNCVPVGTYADLDAVSAVLAADGAGSTLDADLLDGQEANAIIAAASDEVRIPISTTDLPLVISTSGAYYFAENLSHSQTVANAIEVDSSDVTIDLMGFELVGPGGNTGAGNSGIAIIRTNVTVMNGTVRGFGGEGISADNAFADGHRVIDVRVVSNGGNGIALDGANNQVRGCSANGNFGAGIVVGPHSLVTSSTATENSGGGISAGTGSTVSNNTAGANTGLFGITTGTGATVVDNSVNDNRQWGILAGTANLISNNTITSNNDSDTPNLGGLRVRGDSRAVGNALDGNGVAGIVVETGDAILDANHITDSPTGIDFSASGSAYRNNTVAGVFTAFGGAGLSGSNDLGGNASF